jgi:cell wall-associated NlpC family hydrolase
MGVRLPLADPDTLSQNVDGQNPHASHAVRLPVRSENGELGFRTALIARSQDISLGYLPFTRRNIIQQAFKFLGERYGWGHSYNARDCTGLVSEVYRTVGIFLPRNSSQQGNSPIGENIRFAPDDSAEEKLKTLTSADVGDLLYSTGHVMLYLGTMDGQPYVIHDLSGSGGVGEDGKYEEDAINGVSVTPLSPMHVSQAFTYLEKMYAIKKIA